MPFVGTARIIQLEKGEIKAEKVGDICALAYKPMVEMWLVRSSWTTWSQIRRDVKSGVWKLIHLDSRESTWKGLCDHEEAENQVEAALEVFYDRYVSDYENEKLAENGGVINEQH